MSRKADKIDDLYSLLYVAYEFARGMLPWHKCYERAIFNDEPMDTKAFMKLRYAHKMQFDQKICKNSGDLFPLFEFLNSLRLKWKQ